MSDTDTTPTVDVTPAIEKITKLQTELALTDAIEAVRTLANLRRKLLRWEANLTTNATRYEKEGSPESARSARRQLDIVHEIFDVIGR